jgi:hypothetical protein
MIRQIGTRPGVWDFLSENRTLFLAAIGLVIVVGLHFNQSPNVIREPATTEDIDKAAAPAIAAANERAETLRSELADTRQHIASLQSRLDAVDSSVNVAAPSASTLSPEDIVTKIDIWKSALGQLDDFSKALTFEYDLVDSLAEGFKNNKSATFQKNSDGQQAILRAVIRFHGLADSSRKYPDIYKVLRDDTLQNTVDATSRYYRAVDDLPNDLPENYQATLKPYYTSLKQALDAARAWETATRLTAAARIRELSYAGPK